jgi:hypothetical protein
VAFMTDRAKEIDKKQWFLIILQMI